MSRMVCIGTVPIGELVILKSSRGKRIVIVSRKDEFGRIEVLCDGNYNTNKIPYSLTLEPTHLVEVD